VRPGVTGPENQFDIAVYDRGALAVQALRNEIGDEAFFEVLKGWPQRYAYGNASVADFQRYAEEVSGKPLAALFDTWLFQPSKPAAPAARAASLAKASVTPAQPRSWKKIAATNDVHEH
jgi:aminopeptidase N